MAHIKYGQSLEILPPWLSGTRERNESESWNINQDAKHARTWISSGTDRRIDDISLHQTHLSRFHAGNFNEMHPTVTHEIRFRLVECHATRKIHFKNKDYIFQKSWYYKLHRVLSTDEGGQSEWWMLFSQYKIMLPLLIAFRTCGGSWRGRVLFGCFTYCSRTKSDAFRRSEMVSSCFATLLRRTNSLECLLCFSGTLAMKGLLLTDLHLL